MELSSSNTSKIMQMPHEILSLIFCRLMTEHIKTARKVCRTFNKSVEGAWKTFIDSWWGLDIDMNYIATVTFEVRMESQFRLEPRVDSEAAGVVGERDPPPNG
jgi:hypothetical protein